MLKTFTLGRHSDHSQEHFDFEVDVVDVDSYWVVLACITIFSVNFPIVSLLGPKTERGQVRAPNQPNRP